MIALSFTHLDDDVTASYAFMRLDKRVFLQRQKIKWSQT